MPLGIVRVQTQLRTFDAKLTCLPVMLDDGCIFFQPVSVSQLKVGSVCLALFEDETSNFYRARIVNVYKQQGMADVFFLDYGNSDKVPFSNLRRLDSDLKTMEAQVRLSHN